MLVREKVVLAMLQKLGRPASPIRLVKLLFLLRCETDLAHSVRFYDFVPYKFGPFSFSLYRELGNLERNGYVTQSANGVALTPIQTIQKDWIGELTDSTATSIRFTLELYGSLPEKELLRKVYGEYPWFALNSELTGLLPDSVPRRPKAEPAVYTVGYQGRTVDSFFAALLKKGVVCLLDVRSNPVSRNYGFAKKSLRSISAKLGIDYEHFPELGIPGSERKDLGTPEDYARLLNWYEESVVPKESKAVASVSRILRRKPAALVCYESDASFCHRGRLAKELSRSSGLPIVHLE